MPLDLFNIFLRKKKLNTTLKVQRLMTGGGCPSTILNDPVMNVMDAATPNLDVEVFCPFDSTAVFEKECTYIITVHHNSTYFLNQYLEFFMSFFLN